MLFTSMPRITFSRTLSPLYQHLTLASLSLSLLLTTAASSSWAEKPPAPPSPQAQSNSSTPFYFYAMGDMPYRKKDRPLFDTLIQQLNQHRDEKAAPAFSIHVGDIKSGQKPCTRRRYQWFKEHYHRLNHPALVTPGDNEWTDCHRILAGRYNPTERLEVLRQMFFSKKELTLLPLRIRQQSDIPHTPFLKYTENLSWNINGITFGTLHVVGSNNNRNIKHPRRFKEYEHRSQANNAWMREIFRQAKKQHSKGVVLIIHADPRFGVSPKIRSGFNRFHKELAKQVQAFNGNVLLIHGDSHRYKFDMPLLDSKNKIITNFERLIVFGDSEVHAVKVMVTPDHTIPFTIQPVIRTASPHQ